MAFGLNRFTGLDKTPIELAWLIREHQRLAREVYDAAAAFEARGRRVDERRLEVLREQLRCVDVVIALHPARFDPKLIPTVRRKAPRLYPYGALSRDILNLLRGRAGKPISTAQVARTVAKARGLVLAGPMRLRNHKAVLLQLNALQASGLVEVLPVARQDAERYWRLKALRD